MKNATNTDNWRDYLKPEERERLDALEALTKGASEDRLKIRKRCWRRMLQARDQGGRHAPQ